MFSTETNGVFVSNSRWLTAEIASTEDLETETH
jgi:hypothetical protein